MSEFVQRPSARSEATPTFEEVGKKIFVAVTPWSGDTKTGTEMRKRLPCDMYDVELRFRPSFFHGGGRKWGEKVLKIDFSVWHVNKMLKIDKSGLKSIERVQNATCCV